MKAAVYYQNGGPEVLRYEDVPDPVCGPDEVLVRTEAISLEGGDLLHRQSSPLPACPHIVGYSTAGTVVGVGVDVTGFSIGQKVISYAWSGSHAELRAVKAFHCWPLPAGLGMEAAAGIPASFGTAHECLFRFGQLQAGETVFIPGVAGGVGLAALQLAKRAGARVIGTAGSQERLEKLRGFGLDVGINYKTANVAEEIRKATGNAGVHLAIDAVGGASLQAAVETLADCGRLIIAGCSARESCLINAIDVLVKRLSVTGVFIGYDMDTPRFDTLIRDIISDVAEGKLTMAIDRCFPLKDAVAAHIYAESKDRGFGRVVMVP